MKRKLALLLALVMMFSIAGPVYAEEDPLIPSPEASAEPDAHLDEQGGLDTQTNADPAPEATEVPTPEPEASATPEPEVSPEPTPEASEEPEPSATPEPETSPEPSPEASEEPEPSTSPEPSASPEPEEDGLYDTQWLAYLPEAAGRMDVSIRKALDLGDFTPVFTAVLTRDGAEAGRHEVPADGSAVRFSGLEEGAYTLTVTGQGFATFSQSIQVGKSDGMTVQLTAGRLAGYDAGAHPGVLQIGDVDGDGDVDEADRVAMMQAVSGQSDAGFTDLNHDGVTTLADAEYLAKGQAVGQQEATVEHFVPAEAIESAVGEDTEVTGMENLFEDNGQSVQIARAEGETPISPETPVEVAFGLPEGAQAGAILIEQTNIASGSVLIEYEDGTTAVGTIGEAQPVSEIATIAAFTAIDMPVAVAEVTVTQKGGDIVVDLGTQKAVKKVTLTITGTSDTLNLAEISQVEFVNDMDERIPEPAPDIPLNVIAVEGSRQFTVSWSECVNITGYEAEVSAQDCAPETYSLTGKSLTVTRFGNDEVLNYTTYTVRVRSVNGSWSSGWSKAVSVTPKPTSAPDKPDNVKATGAYQTVNVSWKRMKDTTSYDLYYKQDGAAEFIKIADLTANSYAITGLDSTKATKYEVYVVGKNEFGESAPSMHASALTVTLDPPEMPRFNLINRDSAGKPGRDHIQSAVMGSSGGVMNSSPLDTETGTAWGTVDGDGASYYDRKTWDDGGYNNLSASVGLIYTFDAPYKMDTIGMMSAVDSAMDYTYIKLRWWDEAGTEHYIDRNEMSSERRTDSSGRTYFFLRLPEPVEAKKVQIGVARYWAGNNRVNVSEVYFYKYDTLKQQLRDLYADDLHTTLKDTVTAEQLDALEEAINASVDEFGEVNPDRTLLLRELETARLIYNDQFLGRVIRIHTGITASGDDHGFGGLNAWQPLGVTAAAGESVTIYVGNSSMKTGALTNLQLVATQYHAESSAMSKVLVTLRIGANEIKLPKIWTNTGMESGGALYVQYTGGASASDSYAVRVSGGTEVPVLDLYHVTDSCERSQRVADYLTALQSYVGGIQAAHEAVHQGENAVSTEVDYPYDAANCILGATDIMLDTMMLSLPAQQVVKGCGGSAQTLLGSLDAMENMMYLFYQHKGLNASAPDAADRIPNRHLNIRYQRMFSGAFMYASGDHIGIEWNETAGMAGCGGVVYDGNGLYQSGNYFGWGVAHEIGHDINQGSYAIAEITNNYFAVLAQAKDSNDSVRFQYPKVYEKVTSGTRGRASDVFTQLAMYWQLHLAYDSGYNFKTYPDYKQQLANLFYARVDTYARTPKKAPAPGGVALTLDGAGVDQTIMRLACAAAERDLTDFFLRWGMTPDETTLAYAGQFKAESRAICYVCDDSRRYTMEHPSGSHLAADGTTNAVGTVTVAADPDQANRVNITLGHNGAVSDEEVLGYEIVRCTVAAGKVEKRTVGFATGDSFSDVVYAMNNRAVYYEITLVDQYLNRSAAVVTGTVKIRHEGDLDKNGWTVTTTGLTADPNDIGSTGGDEDMPEVIPEDVAQRIADGKSDTVYRATVGEGACIEIGFGQTQVITGFRYTAGSGTAIAGYAVDVHQNGQWVRAAEGTLDGDKTVYFSNADGRYVSTYSADGMRLALTGQAGQMISVAELGALGLSGDNVEFRRTDDSGQPAIGYLSAAFKYGDAPDDVIPAGSLVFTGAYKGNAAYNVVVLYDQDGKMVAGTAADGTQRVYQTIMADLPDTGKIEDVNDGVWICWIQPEDMPEGYVPPRKVRAELYRVNDAITNEGHRLVSDSLFVDVPSPLGTVTLQSASVG